ncbi:GIN domain-containing protein [Robiginitalea sp. IMCC43444]|uniref:GIN domain-containing protein n=1 Tax=Robiginitalea sp. IMCC43444 TaxID=3459121 RepID=UPI004042F2F4
MNKYLSFLGMVLISLSLSAQKKTKIAGNREVSLLMAEIPQDFNVLEVNDNLEISLSQGDASGYRLSADSNLHTVVQFVVIDSILKVFTTEEITSSKKLEIQLTVKRLEHLVIKDDSKVKGERRISAGTFYLMAYSGSRFELDVEADDFIATLHRNAGGNIQVRAENTTLIMNDRTDMKANVVSKKVRVTLNNTADLDLEGDADLGTFSLKKASTLNARNMRVSTADLYTSNTSDVYVHATRNLEVYAEGRSNVYVYGNPDVEIKGLTDRSKIIKR